MSRTEGDGRQSSAVVLYGGKGGVGKTTCAAAHALAVARREADTETLVVSTDPAHSLGDAFEQELGGEPTAVTDRLDAVEVDPQTGQDAYRAVVEALAAELRDAGLRVGDDDLERLFETGLIPGGDEVAALEYIARYTAAGYDTVVFDTAPTGHTLRLFDLPEVFEETLGVASDVRQRLRRTARTARSMVVGPIAYWGGDDDVDDIAALRDRLTAVGDLLSDPTRTRFRVVLTPERLAIVETERLVARLEAAAVPVDCLVANRLFENQDGCSCDRCRRDAARHAQHLQAIDARFDRPVRRVPELADEPRRREQLAGLGQHLLADRDL